jgi:signal transduction histidine kinase
MAVLHHEALGKILPLTLGFEDSTQVVKEAKSFFVESLTPFEMTHRGFRDANSALQRLNEKLEEEAKRIAHSLHDEAGQFLACVHIALEEVGRELPPRFRKRLREIRGLLDQVEGQLRRLSHELRPTILDDLGLLPALEFLAEGVSKRAALPITVEGRRNGRLPSAIETILYRVVQEALTNVSKHAQATHASVQIQRQPGSILCSIRDDGVGFDVPVVMKKKGQRGLGLVGIRERVAVIGGTLQIHSEPGHGTEMLITVPLEV